MFQKKTLSDYRKGAVGAMMDEYERAAEHLKSVLLNVSETDFSCLADAKTEDESCRSIQTVMNHVVRAGYGYANYFRGVFSMEKSPDYTSEIDRQNIIGEIDKMLAYTAESFDGRWEMTDDEISDSVIKTRYGGTYDIEQMFEHAIVHILRHRRQIEKFLLKFENES